MDEQRVRESPRKAFRRADRSVGLGPRGRVDDMT